MSDSARGRWWRWSDAKALIVDAVRAVKIGEALRIVGREEATQFEARVKLFERARPKTQSIER